MPSQIVTNINDLSSVQLRVRVHYGWRARVAAWLLRLATWIGRNQIEFVGASQNE